MSRVCNLVFFYLMLTSLMYPIATKAAEITYQRYSWQANSDADYYEGFVTRDNGKVYRFRTKNQQVILPTSEEVKVVPYAKTKKSFGKSQALQAVDVKSEPITLYELKDEEVLASQEFEEPEELEEAEDNSYYDQYLDDEYEEQEQQAPVAEEQEARPPAKSSAFEELYKKVEVIFGFGREKIKLKGGISVLDNQSNIGTTEANAGACLGEEGLCQQYFQLHMKAHKFTSEYQLDEDTTKDISLLLIEVQLRANKQWNFGSNSLRLGLGFGSTMLPSLVVTDPVVGTAKIDRRQTGLIQGLLGYQYQIDHKQSIKVNWHHGLYALNFFNSYQSYELSFWWEYLFYENFYSKLGVLSKKITTTYNIDCDEALEGCESGNLEDQTTSFHYGVGYQL